MAINKKRHAVCAPVTIPIPIQVPRLLLRIFQHHQHRSICGCSASYAHAIISAVRFPLFRFSPVHPVKSQRRSLVNWQSKGRRHN